MQCPKPGTLKQLLNQGLTTGTQRTLNRHVLSCALCRDRIGKINDHQVIYERVPLYSVPAVSMKTANHLVN